MRLALFNKYQKQILKIALPAIAGLSVQIVVSMVDAAMVGRLEKSEYALAAMGIGVLATWAIVSFFSSLATGTHVLVARRFGKNEFSECADVLINSIYISVVIGIITALAGVLFAYEISGFFAKDRLVGLLAGEYIQYRILGIPFFLISVSYRGFYFGIGHTKVFMISGVLVNVLNIFFNYIFIYGEFGFEPMGLAGAGLGSTLATACDVIFYFLVSLSPAYYHKFKLYKRFRIDREILNWIYKISLPVAFQSVFILIGFLSFIAITGLIGITEQAASQAIISTLFLSFMPCFGFGIAVQTLVGNNAGKGKLNLAKIYGFETAKIATMYTTLLSLIFVLIPEYLLLIITTNRSVIEAAVPAMKIVGVAQIFYATGVVLANGLQAFGLTTFVMFSEVVTNLLIFVPLAYYLGVYLGFGLVGAWLALPAYIVLYSLIIYLKFRVSEAKTI